ncbi:glycosyltransferase family 39 protein [Candidatus Woesearchaeota archaeon]|nr:glycosyltransferase family 39 protein [Candidatus Woesearchaeota archaeon]
MLLIFILGSALRLFVFPHYHIMYVDEPSYLEAAKNINQKFQPVICEYGPDLNENCRVSPKPPAWPFLISIAFKLFGLNNYVALYLSSILGSLSIILVFLFVYLLFKNEKIALWSSFFLALTPVYIIWSNSAETNNPSLFFVLLTLLFFVLYLKTQEKPALVMTALLLIFAPLVRFENIILIPVFFLIYIKFYKNHKNKLFSFLNSHYTIIIFFALIVMVILEWYLISFFRRNFLVYAIDYYYLNIFHFLKEVSFNYIYLFLAALIIFFRNKGYGDKIVFIFILFISFFILYLPIYSESRMALAPGIFVIILSAYSLEKICNFFMKYLPRIRIFVLLMFILIFSFALSQAHRNAEDVNKSLETESAAQIQGIIPEGCYVISEFPTVLNSVSNIKGLRTLEALKNATVVDEILDKNECIYYFYDGYCTELVISPVENSKKRCKDMLKKFHYIEEARFKKNDTEYLIFRINGSAKV